MKEKISISNFYCFIYFIWGLYAQFVNTTNISFLQNNKFIDYFVNIIAIVFLLIMFLTEFENHNFQINIKKVILAFIFFILILCVSFRLYGLFFFTGCLFVLLSSYVETNKILKSFIYFSATTLIITIVFNKLGLVDSVISVGDRVRTSLGFSYMAEPSEILFYVTCSYLVYKKQDITYIEIMGLELLNVLLYSATQTRTPFFMATLALIGTLILKLVNFKVSILNNKLIKFVIVNIYWICLALFFVLLNTYPDNVFWNLNKLLSGRLYLSLLGLQRWGISLWGTNTKFVTDNVANVAGGQYNYIDSSYLQSLIIYGLIFTIIVLVMFSVLTYVAIRRKDVIFILILICVAIHSMFDPILLVQWYSPFFIIAGKCFNLFSKDRLYYLARG